MLPPLAVTLMAGSYWAGREAIQREHDFGVSFVEGWRMNWSGPPRLADGTLKRAADIGRSVWDWRLQAFGPWVAGLVVTGLLALRYVPV